jgi:hypothetical protein
MNDGQSEGVRFRAKMRVKGARCHARLPRERIDADSAITADPETAAGSL